MSARQGQRPVHVISDRDINNNLVFVSPVSFMEVKLSVHPLDMALIGYLSLAPPPGSPPPSPAGMGTAPRTWATLCNWETSSTASSASYHYSSTSWNQPKFTYLKAVSPFSSQIWSNNSTIVLYIFQTHSLDFVRTLHKYLLVDRFGWRTVIIFLWIKVISLFSTCLFTLILCTTVSSR